jgi:hypothetical protein
MRAQRQEAQHDESVCSSEWIGSGKRWRCHLAVSNVFIFLLRSRLEVHLDSVHHCTETSFLIQGIPRAKSSSSTSVHVGRGPVALPYLPERRLEEHRFDAFSHGTVCYFLTVSFQSCETLLLSAISTKLSADTIFRSGSGVQHLTSTYSCFSCPSDLTKSLVVVKVILDHIRSLCLARNTSIISDLEARPTAFLRSARL